MLYRYGVIRSFLLFLLSMNDVLYYYPHFIEREMRSREAWNMGKKKELEIWTHDFILAITYLGNVPLPAHFTSSSKDISFDFSLMEIFSFQLLVACLHAV